MIHEDEPTSSHQPQSDQSVPYEKPEPEWVGLKSPLEPEQLEDKTRVWSCEGVSSGLICPLASYSAVPWLTCSDRTSACFPTPKGFLLNKPPEQTAANLNGDPWPSWSFVFPSSSGICPFLPGQKSAWWGADIGGAPQQHRSVLMFTSDVTSPVVFESGNLTWRSFVPSLYLPNTDAKMG